ncbi:MAG: hypothetical protein ACTSPQ_17360, partial [Candidatus Helarchaeota archaeon]
DKIANKIQELIIKLKDENPEQFNELINKYYNEISEYNQKTEQELANDNKIDVCILYRKAGRIAVQMGDNETAGTYFRAADEIERNL